MVTIVVVGGTAYDVWALGHTDSHPRSGAIVVLGAAQFDGRPSATLQARLEHARDLFNAGVAPYVVTVGGKQADDRFTEAETGQRWLVEHGVPAAALIVVPQGQDTLLSLRAAAPVLRRNHVRSVVVVTDPWHELRSRQMLRDLGFRAEASPDRGGPAEQGTGTQVRYIARETTGYLYYAVFRRPGHP